MKEKKCRLIAFYLPQFHPIPENDAWWGKGFTEWTNVAKAKPLFSGHYQPRIPADLGFYDLRVPETRMAQSDLAEKYGIEGFCYWHYWFAGKRLLERPFNEVLKSGEPKLPFCLGWANDSWTGIWHGCPDRILISQTYPGIEDYKRHFYALIEAFSDDRYMSIDGKKIFLIYKPRQLPSAEQFTDYWRELALKVGLKGFYFIGIIDHPWEPFNGGFDAFTTNPPVAMVRSNPDLSLNVKCGMEKPEVYSYKTFIENAFPKREYFPCVVPNWDNTPRSGLNGFVLHESTPELYSLHLKQAVELVNNKREVERLVFLKSWNEWAEGNYLEPDQVWGCGYLEETLKIVMSSVQKR